MSNKEHQEQTIEGIGLAALQDPSFTAEQKEYLSTRWLGEVRYFANATRRSRRLHDTCSVLAIFSGALTALMTGLNRTLSGHPLDLAIMAVGAVTAATAGFSSSFRDWDNWKLRSLTLENLKTEGRMFLLLSARYKKFPSRSEAFSEFAESIEKIVKEHKMEFFARKPGKNE